MKSNSFKINQAVLFKAMQDKKIKNLRELSRKEGICYATICNLLKPGHKVYLATLLKLSSALDIPVDDLIEK